MRPIWLKKRDDIASAREGIEDFRRANSNLRGFLGRMYAVIQKELAAQGVQEQDRKRLATTIFNHFAKARTLFPVLQNRDDDPNNGTPEGLRLA